MPHFIANRLFNSKWDIADYIALTFASLVVVWLAIPSSVFIKPVALKVTDDEFRVVWTRSVPFGQVQARWSEEVRGPAQSCYHPGGLSVYEVGPGGGRTLTVTWPMPKRLVPCIESEHPFTVAQTHGVRALGLVPLRSSVTTWYCAELNEECIKQ